MKWCRKLVLVLCLMVVVTLCGCSKKEEYESTEPPSAERIAQTNRMRKELGLREIKDDDDLVFKITERWNDNMGNKCKSVICNKDEEILSEIDFYYSGRSFQRPDKDSPVKELLMLNYNYRKKNYTVFAVSGDEKILSLVEEWRNTEQRNEENLWYTEKILKIWGLHRL